MTQEELAPLLVPYSDDEESAAMIRKVLSENGVAVVTGVLSTEDCSKFEELKKLELEQKSSQPGYMSHAQGELAWKARFSARNSFAQAFDTQALSTSTDIPSIFYTPAGTPPQLDNRQWIHVDQNTLTGGTHLCYQGILYVRSSAPESSSTTALWPRSHSQRVYSHMVKSPAAVEKMKDTGDSGLPYGDALMDKDIKPDILQQALDGVRRVPVPAGALLLFDSRTIHQGWYSGERFSLPVCWEPRNRVGEDVRGKKSFLAAGGFATCHSPSEGRLHPAIEKKSFPKSEEAFGRPPGVRPFSVLPEASLPTTEWEKVWEHWTKEEFIEDMAKCDSAPFVAVLRPEVAAAL